MGQNTSIYWASSQTAQRAKQLAASRGISVSQLVSKLIEKEHKAMIPPLEGTCPTCKAETTFVFLATWDGLPGGPAQLYQCQNCKTTLQEQSIKEPGAGIAQKEALTDV